MKIPLSRVYQSDEIDRRILQVVHGGDFILGPECKAFEAELAAYFGVKHAVLASSWTAAAQLLHIAQGIKNGDEILVPSLTAFPTIEPMIHAGARPVFCDVDETYTIDVEDARRKITPKTVGIMPVHLYGRPANLEALGKLAAEYGCWLVEDCAQSHGARYHGKRCGSIGAHGAISFYPSKNLTVFGDGGAVITNDAPIAEQIRMLRNHGRKDKYLHEKVGFNLRFNEIQAAVGREQLKVLDQLNARRRAAARMYRRELADVRGVTLPPDDVPGQTESVYHMFVIRLPSRDQREKTARHLKECGIQTGVHYPVPNHQQPAISNLYGTQPPLPRTEDWVGKILSLPMFPAIGEDEIVTVCRAVKNSLHG
ncbi:MAG TPA: DegT/DnrJ/EryC1/StrS family aminotransferase [Tepidisphaeraceae bacterium]|nr:DegT/DnrJ/EryC1/StrS family aminotransferase [Tepidisphaeraceae bacterium]